MEIWDQVRLTFEDYFPRHKFSFEIFRAEAPEDTECSAVLRIDDGPREQKMRLLLESEDNINYLRVVTPLAAAERFSKEQLVRLMEQNFYWVKIQVGVERKQVVFTTLVSFREFEADPAALGEAMTSLARRADQMESLLFGTDSKFSI